MRVLIGTILVLLAILGLAYATLPSWLPAAVRIVLERQGASNVDIRIARPGARTLPIGRLAFDWGGFAVRVEQTELHYDWGSLRRGRLAAVHIAALSATQRRVGPSVPDGPASVALPAPGLAWQHPADRVRVDAVHIELVEPPLEVVGRFEQTEASTAFGFANVAAGDLQGLSVTGTLARVGAVTADVALPARSHPLAHLEGWIDADGGAAVAGQVRLETPDFGLLDPLIGIRTTNGALKLTFDARYRGAEMAATGTFRATWHGAVPSPVRFDGSGDFSLEPSGRLTVVLDGASTLDVELAAEPSVVVALRSPVDFELSVLEGTASLSGGAGLTVPTVARDDGTLGYDGGWLDLRRATIGPHHLEVQGQLTGILRTDDHSIPNLVEFGGTVDGSVLRGTVRLGSPALTARVPIDLSHDLDAGRGSAVFRAALSIDKPLPAAVLPGWREPFGVAFEAHSGRIAADGSAHWRLGETVALQGEATLALGALGGVVMDTPFRGVTGTLGLHLTDTDWRIESSDLAVAWTDPGVAVTDVGGAFELGPEALSVRSLRGRTLGGTLHTDPFRYQMAAGEARFDVHVEGVQLADVLALEGDDFTGSGVLNGVVPIAIDGAAVTVTNGRLSAVGGGFIRYAGASEVAAAAGQPGLDFALRALSDFAYQRLDVTVDYARDGTLSLAVALEGRNPRVEKGRPIHYNLSVTENVPNLLKSLRLSDEVSEGIQKRLNR